MSTIEDRASKLIAPLSDGQDSQLLKEFESEFALPSHPVTESLPGDLALNSTGRAYSGYPKFPIEATGACAEYCRHPSTFELDVRDDTTLSPKKIIGRVAAYGAFAASALGMFHTTDSRLIAPLVWGDQTLSISQFASESYSGIRDLDNPATNIVVIGGTGNRGAVEGVGIPLLPSFELIPNSKMFAIKEGAALHLPSTFEQIDAMMESSPCEHILLYGSSVGGKEAILIAQYVAERWPGVRITIVEDSSPFDASTAYALRSTTTLAFQDFLEQQRLYGGIVERSIIDMVSSRDKYIDSNGLIEPNAFYAEMGRIGRDIWGGVSSSNELYSNQVSLVRQDPTDALLQLGELSIGKPPFTFIYLAPTNDRTVDTKLAVEHYRSVIENTTMTFIVIPVAANHAGTRNHPDAYNQVFIPALENLKKANDIYESSKNIPSAQPRVGGQ